MDVSDYYTECVECSLYDNGFGEELSKEQIADIACHVGADVAVATQHESQAFGWDVADSNLAGEKKREKERLEKELQRERNASFCHACKGTGKIRIDGPCHYTDETCHKCKGTGKIYND